MKWMAWKTIKEITREPRTLAFLILAPLLIMTLIYFALASNSDPKIAILARGSSRFFIGDFENALRNEDIEISGSSIADDLTDYAKIKELAFKRIQDGFLDAVIYLDKSLVEERVKGNRGKIHIFVDGASSITTAKVFKAVSASMDDLNEAMPVMGDENCSHICLESFNNQTIDLEKVYHYTNEDYDDVDYFVPYFPPFIIFFLTFITTTIFFQRERIRGTLKYLLTTPISLPQIYWGFNLGFSIFSLFQIIIIMVFTSYLFGESISIPMMMGWILAIIIAQQIGLFVGLLCSLLAKTEFQVMQFIPIVILPQVFLSNMIWPIKDLPPFLQKISFAMPLTQINLAITEIVLRQNGINFYGIHILYSLCFLLASILVFHFIGIKILNRSIK